MPQKVAWHSPPPDWAPPATGSAVASGAVAQVESVGGVSWTLFELSWASTTPWSKASRTVYTGHFMQWFGFEGNNSWP
jgi:hypothetical protein